MRDISYAGPVNDTTLFAEDAGRVWLRRLCGLPCGNDGQDNGPVETQGPAILVTSLGRFEGGAFQLSEQEFDATTARLAWSVADGALRLETVWTFCPQTGVISRRDRLVNTGSKPATVFRVQARFAFPSGRYEVYAQQSRWCNENQGRWLSLHAGSLRFGCVQGRITQGGTPYMCLREIDAGRGVAFHVVTRGNWSIEAAARPIMDVHPFAVVHLGMASDDLRLELPPGGVVECPELLIQPLPTGEPADAAPRLHRWWQNHRPAGHEEMPVVFNTWFDQFEVLELPRLREQLQAAKEVGCEVFVVDAGWYGPQAGDWFAQAGDWREKLDGAFRGSMSAFADEVRAAGLGFGLWMEPERFGPNVPILKEHPEWFRPGQSPFFRIDLEHPAAYEYLRGEISRLVETYKLAWMKIDFNFELGFDATGAELAGYYEAWYRLLDEIRQRHSQTVFEGCSSGAMRLDLGNVSHVDGHFLTDTVNPVDVVRIGQGALLRLPPGHLTKWACVRSVGKTIPRYTKSVADSPVSIVTPCCALWDPSETVEVDFVMAAAIPGVFGLGGDLAGLPAEARARIAQHVAFFRQWRKVIRRSIAHLLTPPMPKMDREGWAALQLADPQGGSALLFVYRLNDGSSAKRFALRELDANARYVLTRHTPSGQEPQTVRGGDLMADGIEVQLPARYQAAIFALTPEGRDRSPVD
ncbi:MAG: alpha-galactosidase [Thermoguttaceae bacterium]